MRLFHYNWNIIRRCITLPLFLEPPAELRQTSRHLRTVPLPFIYFFFPRKPLFAGLIARQRQLRRGNWQPGHRVQLEQGTRPQTVPFIGKRKKRESEKLDCLLEYKTSIAMLCCIVAMPSSKAMHYQTRSQSDANAFVPA